MFDDVCLPPCLFAPVSVLCGDAIPWYPLPNGAISEVTTQTARSKSNLCINTCRSPLLYLSSSALLFPSHFPTSTSQFPILLHPLVQVSNTPAHQRTVTLNFRQQPSPPSPSSILSHRSFLRNGRYNYSTLRARRYCLDADVNRPCLAHDPWHWLLLLWHGPQEERALADHAVLLFRRRRLIPGTCQEDRFNLFRPD